MNRIRRSLLAACAVLGALTPAARAQETAKRVATGWEFVGLPALNFSTDEGFGYGVLAEIYNYGTGVQPYRFTIQPTVFLTTKGRRDVILFFDAPKLLPNDWRLDVTAARELQLATPYYGEGNGTTYTKQAELPPNPYYYRYERLQFRVQSNLQHRLGSASARALFGAGFVDARTDATPFDSGTTLLATELAGAPAPRGRVGFLRSGIIWDTRDREIGPRSGLWAELLAQRVARFLGASTAYSRVTATVRHYRPLAANVVGAVRVLVQQASGDVPLYDEATIQTSYKQQEGLGGGNSLRGIPRNRFIGKGLALANAELRWTFTEFTVRNKPAFLLLSGFVDAGRVWKESIKLGELASDLHTGYGGGLRVGLGPSFVVAFDLGKSSESTQLYIGLGYPF